MLTGYLLLINAAGFALMLVDKQKAIKNKWRIPERNLLALALLGGSLGVYAGMQIFRHKTRTPKFFIGVPILMSLQILAGIFIYLHS